jgi:Glutathione S-transferase, N-terminal domain
VIFSNQTEALVMALYWAPRTRSLRALWVLEEAGAPYQRVRINLSASEQKSAEFRAINPMAKVPALTDGTLAIAESGAICAYPRRQKIGARRRSEAMSSKTRTNERACPPDRSGKFLLKLSHHRRHHDEFGEETSAATVVIKPCLSLHRLATLRFIGAMRRHGRRVLAMASRSDHKGPMLRFPKPALLVR